MSVPTYDQVREAAELIAPWVRRTPVLDVEVEGRRVALKLELLQHAGSFKARGAFTNVLTAAERPRTLVAASGGNHGLAVAHAGQALGIPARIFVPETAPGGQGASRSQERGAEVNLVGATYAEALAASREAGEQPGALVLHAYDAPATVAGQGTLGLELAEQVPDVDTVLVAVGGGGLVSGRRARARRTARRRGGRAGGVPDAAPRDAGGRAGRRAGRRGRGRRARCLAARRRSPGRWCRSTTSTSVLVTDEAITEARQWLWRHVRLAAEPAGATALAALLSGAYVPAEGERVCVVVCGGNADPSGL